MLYNLIFLSILFFSTESIFAQINGRVSSKQDGQPLSEVNVIVDGDGTSTDKFGKFSVEAPIGSKIVFSHLYSFVDY